MAVSGDAVRSQIAQAYSLADDLFDDWPQHPDGDGAGAGFVARKVLVRVTQPPYIIWHRRNQTRELGEGCFKRPCGCSEETLPIEQFRDELILGADPVIVVGQVRN